MTMYGEMAALHARESMSGGRDMQDKRIYVASVYRAHPLMRQWRDALRPFGIAVVARWIDGGHELGEHPTDDGRRRLAVEDLEDVAAAEAVVVFNPASVHRSGRGGRHVEVGYALGLGKPLILVGERENVFHWMIPAERVLRDLHLCEAGLLADAILRLPREAESALASARQQAQALREQLSKTAIVPSKHGGRFGEDVEEYCCQLCQATAPSGVWGALPVPFPHGDTCLLAATRQSAPPEGASEQPRPKPPRVLYVEDCDGDEGY